MKRRAPPVGLVGVLLLLAFGAALSAERTSGPRFEVSFAKSVHVQPITGRLFLLISQRGDPEPRLQSMWFNSPEIVALDVTNQAPGVAAVIDATHLGTPLASVEQLPAGEYFVQAVLNGYTEFHRLDGHTVWAHMDQGEGQQFNTSPGNLYSKVHRLRIDHSGSFVLRLTEVIPPIAPAADTEWVKHVQIQSRLLTRFWGRPIFLGAVVLLPRGYASNPQARYPTIYYQPEHFRRFPPFEFNDDLASQNAATDRNEDYESGYQFSQTWASDRYPRMIAVSLQTPSPLSDWSGAADSANNGPYGQAIMTELIPAIEARFHVIPESYARVLTGRASGGRAALALQLQYPHFFGGAWTFHPWPFDFHSLHGLDIYDNDNAYLVKAADLGAFSAISEWRPVERIVMRTGTDVPLVTLRQLSQHDAVMAGMAAGDPIGANDVINGPVGPDGYPQRLWDRVTGQIDRDVANYWRENGDLTYYAQKNWAAIGSDLIGKLHIYAGDRDEFYREQGVRLFEAFLKTTQNPHYEGSFVYGMFQRSWQPMSNAELVRIMAHHIADHAPGSASREWLEE